MNAKIAILGSAPSSIELAPYADPTYEIWGCSPGCFSVAQRTDVWFELHRWQPGAPWFGPAYVTHVEQYPGPVYMSAPTPSVKNCTLLPVTDLITEFGPYFFTSSIAWMFAMAIYSGAKEIGLWGVDMSHQSEYGYQRAGCQYFAMVARARGIEVSVPPESDLLRPPPLYGVCEHTHAWIKTRARVVEIQQRIADAQKRYTEAQQESLFLQGALDDLQWNRDTWHGQGEHVPYTEPPAISSTLLGPSNESTG